MTFYIFLLFGALAVISAILIIFQRNPMHSVLYLAFTVLTTAGVFFTLQADFLGAMQIMVYAGGIVVLYLFVIILINLNEIKVEVRNFFPKFILIAFPIIIITEIAYLFSRNTLPAGQKAMSEPGVQNIGTLLMTKYLIPFEVSSIPLLAVLIGSIIIAKKRTGNDSN